MQLLWPTLSYDVHPSFGLSACPSVCTYFSPTSRRAISKFFRQEGLISHMKPEPLTFTPVGALEENFSELTNHENSLAVLLWLTYIIFCN